MKKVYGFMVLSFLFGMSFSLFAGSHTEYKSIDSILIDAPTDGYFVVTPANAPVLAVISESIHRMTFSKEKPCLLYKPTEWFLKRVYAKECKYLVSRLFMKPQKYKSLLVNSEDVCPAMDRSGLFRKPRIS